MTLKTAELIPTREDYLRVVRELTGPLVYGTGELPQTLLSRFILAHKPMTAGLLGATVEVAGIYITGSPTVEVAAERLAYQLAAAADCDGGDPYPGDYGTDAPACEHTPGRGAASGSQECGGRCAEAADAALDAALDAFVAALGTVR